MKKQIFYTDPDTEEGGDGDGGKGGDPGPDTEIT